MQSMPIQEALSFQDEILPGVSRTFALTIPQLPPALRISVTNAYLLCRIADTIEDEPDLGPDDVKHFHTLFVDVLKGQADPAKFARELTLRLSSATIEAERELVARMMAVIQVTNAISERKREIIIHWVESMCELMPRFQSEGKSIGLKDMHQFNVYCYAVAGTVGEMLTDLFCDYSDEIRLTEDKLRKLTPSFGQGLQMTNILKDIWEDLAQGGCWLPQEVFANSGYDLAELDPANCREAFDAGLHHLIAVAHGHLANAFEYALLIPPNESGIRKFLFWNINMAVLTLRSIYQTPGYRAAKEVKISRLKLYATILSTNVAIHSDASLKTLFGVFQGKMPINSIEQQFFDEIASIRSY